MSLPAAALLAGAAGLVSVRRPFRLALVVGALAVSPLVATALLTLSGLVWFQHRWRARRLDHRQDGDDVVALAELTGLGLSAGLTATQALQAARDQVGVPLAREVDDVLRKATGRGLAAALAGAGGRSRRLCLILSRAVATGAPLAGAVEGFVAEQRAEIRASQLEEARRLPVRLMVPLALLVLPGFVLLTVGPTVLAALDRLVLPL